MATAKLFNQAGSELGVVDLSDAVFNVEPNQALVHQVATALMAAKRQGNAEVKNRAEVSGGGKKPYKQKGTGSARHGSTREAQMRGGGRAFGPCKRSYRQAVPTALRRGALCCVLTDRVQQQALCVLDGMSCPEPKTKPFAEMVERFAPDGKRTLFVTTQADKNAMLSARNLQKVELRTADDLNALDVLNAAHVVVVRDAVAKLEQRLAARGR